MDLTVLSPADYDPLPPGDDRGCITQCSRTVGVKEPVSANKGVNSPGSAYLPHVKMRLQREGAGLGNKLFPNLVA